MATFIATGVSRYTDFGLDLSRSEGRFVALQKSFLDPATVPPGTFLTVTGEMAGTIVLPLDETEYTYPLIHITNLRVWSENDEEAPRIRRLLGPGPYWSPYWHPWPYYWQAPLSLRVRESSSPFMNHPDFEEA